MKFEAIQPPNLKSKSKRGSRIVVKQSDTNGKKDAFGKGTEGPNKVKPTEDNMTNTKRQTHERHSLPRSFCTGIAFIVNTFVQLT